MKQRWPLRLEVGHTDYIGADAATDGGHTGHDECSHSQGTDAAAQEELPTRQRRAHNVVVLKHTTHSTDITLPLLPLLLLLLVLRQPPQLPSGEGGDGIGATRRCM